VDLTGQAILRNGGALRSRCPPRPKLGLTFEVAFLLARSTGDPGCKRAQLTVLRQLVSVLLGVSDDVLVEGVSR
jgi:hypothetical protein